MKAMAVLVAQSIIAGIQKVEDKSNEVPFE